MVKIDSDKCIGCSLCVRVCPSGAITIEHDKAVLNPHLCQGCLLCASVCPKGAIGVVPADNIPEIKTRLSRLSIRIAALRSRLDRLSSKV